MNRQNVYGTTEDEYGQPTTTLAGWFDLDRAKSWTEGTRWDGSNNISLATGSQWEHERLYRTAQGRYVVNSWSQWQGVAETWRFVSDDAAREWMIRNERSEGDIADAGLGDLPDEQGPGRPEIGPAFSVRMPADLVAWLDEEAKRRGTTRAALLRTIAEEARDFVGAQS